MGVGPFTTPSVGQGRTFQRGKTLWDWLQLLVIPLVLAVATLWLNRRAREGERVIEEHRAQETVLDAYFERISTLMLDKGLGEPDKYDVARIARGHTLTAVRRLDGSRKGALVRFLYELLLIGGTLPATEEEIDSGDDANSMDQSDEGEPEDAASDMIVEPVIDLLGADLTLARLGGGMLSGVSFSFADLSGADLHHCELWNADLRGALLINADMRGALLLGAVLEGAVLEGANLHHAQIKGEQLATVQSLKGATMPDGSKFDTTRELVLAEWATYDQESDTRW